MAEFSVTLNELKNKADTLEQYNGQFMQQVAKLEETESALNGMWEGDARKAFHTAFISDMTQMRSFNSAITAYVGALRTIFTQYSNAEAKNVEVANTRSYS